jgi:hypothetical protein
MAKTTKRVIRSKPNDKPLAIKGSFLDVFKVVKKDADKRKKEAKKSK